jgi:aldehyde:ferredoxin oxidoreductase
MIEKMRSLHIDLSTMTTQYQEVPDAILKAYLGGRGLNAWWANELINGETDAFSPDNPLLISAGGLTGTAAVSSARVQLSAVSPLTGLLANSNVGGFWGIELKKKGLISLVITGCAKSPVYISITDTGVLIRSAEDYWGMDTREAAARIRQTFHDEKGYVAVIGPAGERQVRAAAVLFGEGDAAGRTGLGAVMGSKNLKAIAISASSNPIRATRSQMEMAAEHARLVTEHDSFKEWHTYGDSGQVKWLDDFAAGPAYNYRQPQYEQVDSANGYRLAEAPTRYSTCYRCPVRCKASITIPEGPDAGFIGERPPFEPMAAWGAKCGNPDVYTSVFLHTLCNRWGLDSIETASLVAFAMDLSQRGILPQEKTGGERLAWGDSRQMKRLTEEIAFRTSWLGRILGEGLSVAAEVFGPEAKPYAFHVKGMAMTSMDPRGFKGTGLGYCISSRGADFSNPYPSLECGYNPRRSREIFGDEGIGDRLNEAGKGRMVRYTASVSAVLDSLGLCKIPYLSILNDFTLIHPVALVNGIFAWDLNQEDMITIGERIVTLERLINLRLGLNGTMDRLPEKFRKEPMPSGMCAGETVDDQRMVADFYREMGWDADGKPFPDTLAKLNIN